MRLILFFLSIFVFLFKNQGAFAGQYPNISGRALLEARLDRVTASDKKDMSDNNGKLHMNSTFALNFNKNWSLINSWIFEPLNNRDNNNPERYRNILSNRGVNVDGEGLFVEEIKGQFENEDARLFFGKFNPSFGSAFRKEKRIGVFVTDFTQDYELTEKIGFGVSALLENAELTVSTFFNDTSGLSNSMISKRGRTKTGNGIAGNTSTPSSFSLSLEGQDLFGVEDLFYNFGYRSLSVENIEGRADETGFVGGVEYLIPVGLHTSIIPFVEVVNINNWSGEVDRNVNFSTVALIAKYSSWTISISNVIRDIRQKNSIGNVTDSQMQYSIGYKFKNNLVLDVSKVKLEENNSKADLIGANISYLYEF
jgi:hypothetical protein